MKKMIIHSDLQRLVDQCRPLSSHGATASYIPALQKADPEALGVCIALNDGNVLKSGDTENYFTIQSIVKIIIFAQCLLDKGVENVSKRVSVEATNDGFNDITSLETKNKNRPLNPMINAGAISCMSLVNGHNSQEKTQHILSLVCRMAGRDEIAVNWEVFQSEKATGSRNRALAYYMQSTGVLSQDEPVEEILDAYFQACSIEVTCTDLARMALVLANNGTDPITGEEILPKQIAQVIKATMCICGMYNESGRVAVRIGLPTKSGVGGGILSLIPGAAGIGIYGPALNAAGNSVAGLALLEMLSDYMDASIF